MAHSLVVTGVSGFIGRYVAQHFAKSGWQVIGIGHGAKENAPLASLKAFYQLHLPNENLIDVLSKHSPDAFVHCAGRASVGLSIEKPLPDFEANTSLTFYMLEALRKVSPSCKFIFLSSAAVYGNPKTLPVNESQPLSPISPYGFHKLQSEFLCQEFAKVYKLPTTSVRIFSAYGPGLRRQVLWDISYKILMGNKLHLQGTGEEKRDFIHVLDVPVALEKLLHSAPLQGESYNLASGQGVTIKYLAILLLKALELDLPIYFDNELPAGTPSKWQADITKIRELGFEPQIPLEQGVKIFAQWCRAELVGI